jgi:hypothetical protein
VVLNSSAMASVLSLKRALRSSNAAWAEVNQPIEQKSC